MPDKPQPSVPKRQLGQALKQLREQAGVTRAEAIRALDCSESKLIRIESGGTGMKSAELRVWLDLYGCTGAKRAELEQLGAETRKRRPRTSYGTAVPDFFRKFGELEEIASEIRSYDDALITGRLQTQHYTRALLDANVLIDPNDIDRLLEARWVRQERLVSDDPPMVWAVMSEAAIRRHVGSRAIMRDQLEHLLDMAKLTHITLQVSTFEQGAHASLGFYFSLLRFPDEIGVDVVYLEDLTQASYLDRADDLNRQRYATVFEHVSASALSPTASVKFIDKVRKEL